VRHCTCLHLGAGSDASGCSQGAEEYIGYSDRTSENEKLSVKNKQNKDVDNIENKLRDITHITLCKMCALHTVLAHHALHSLVEIFVLGWIESISVLYKEGRSNILLCSLSMDLCVANDDAHEAFLNDADPTDHSILSLRCNGHFG